MISARYMGFAKTFLDRHSKSRIGNRQQCMPVAAITGCYDIKGFGGLFPGSGRAYQFELVDVEFACPPEP